MLQHEFEELIGRQTTEQEYIEANAMYMDALDVDKFDFCKEWETLKDSKVANALLDKIGELRKWQHEGLPLKNHIKLMQEPAVWVVEFLTITGQWCCINVSDHSYEYMEDKEDEETYVEGSIVVDENIPNRVIDYDGVYELPELVRRGLEILNYDISEI